MDRYDELVIDGNAYLTKSLPTKTMDHYEVRNGELWHQAYEIEDRSDPEAKGSRRARELFMRVNYRWERSYYTGEIRFSPDGSTIVIFVIDGVLIYPPRWRDTMEDPPPEGEPVIVDVDGRYLLAYLRDDMWYKSDWGVRCWSYGTKSTIRRWYPLPLRVLDAERVSAIFEAAKRDVCAAMGVPREYITGKLDWIEYDQRGEDVQKVTT